MLNARKNLRMKNKIIFMNFNFNKIILKISFLSLIFFILDRILKYLALTGKIFFYKNKGIAFSINFPENLFLFFYILIFIFLIFIIWNLILSIKNNYKLPSCQSYGVADRQIISYELLLLGSVSNLIDRIKFGFVIDYLNFYFFYNNLADVMIVVGVALLIFSLINKKITQ